MFSKKVNNCIYIGKYPVEDKVIISVGCVYGREFIGKVQIAIKLDNNVCTKLMSEIKKIACQNKKNL
ncbi:MAG: hypothetical protein PVI75_01130 [Gammaproteobacteria bacterium]|jgi:hypothetical protein